MNNSNLGIIKQAFFDHLLPIGYRSVGDTLDGLGIQVYLVCTDCNEVLQNSIFDDLNQLEHLIEVGKDNQKFHDLCLLVEEEVF